MDEGLDAGPDDVAVPVVAWCDRISPITFPRQPTPSPNRFVPRDTRRSRSRRSSSPGSSPTSTRASRSCTRTARCPTRGSSKTSREYVDRFQAWLEAHRDTPFLRLPPRLRPARSIRAEQPYDTPLGRSGAQRRASAPAAGGAEGHPGSAAASVRHAVTRGAREGRPRSAGVRAARQGLVRRLDPRHGRRDRTHHRRHSGASAWTIARCWSS